MSLTAALAQRIHDMRYDAYPPQAIHWAKVALMDTLGVTLAGTAEEGPKILERVVAPMAAPGPCLVLGSGRRLNPLDAALVNGMLSHVLDYDDSNYQIMGHPSVTMLAAILALVDAHGASGRDVLHAFIVGFEAGARIGLGLNPRQYTLGWHPTTSIGIFGAVASAAVLMRLAPAQTAQALGIATHLACGVKSNFGTMCKSFGVGHLSRNGLLACMLAKEGFTSSAIAFEHKQGYLNVFNGVGQYDAGRMLDGWGEPLCMLDQGVSQKHSPVCYACLSSIDGVLELRSRHGLAPEDVESIDCRVHRYRVPHIDVPDPKSDLDAKFSVHYCLARALTHGAVKLEHFENEAFRDPAMQALMARVRFGHFAHDNIMGAEIDITTRDGRRHSTRVEKAMGGGYDHPIPPERLRAKFDECARRGIPATQVDPLYEMLMRLETVADARAVTALLAPSPSAPGAST